MQRQYEACRSATLEFSPQGRRLARSTWGCEVNPTKEQTEAAVTVGADNANLPCPMCDNKDGIIRELKAMKNSVSKSAKEKKSLTLDLMHECTRLRRENKELARRNSELNVELNRLRRLE